MHGYTDYPAEGFETVMQWIKTLNGKLKKAFADLDTHGCKLIIALKVRFPKQTLTVRIFQISYHIRSHVFRTPSRANMRC